MQLDASRDLPEWDDSLARLALGGIPRSATRLIDPVRWGNWSRWSARDSTSDRLCDGFAALLPPLGDQHPSLPLVITY